MWARIEICGRSNGTMQVGCEHYRHIYDLRGPQDEDKGAEKGTKSLALRFSGIAPTKISRGLFFRSLFLQDPEELKSDLSQENCFFECCCKDMFPALLTGQAHLSRRDGHILGNSPPHLWPVVLTAQSTSWQTKKTKQKKKGPLSLRIDVKDELRIVISFLLFLSHPTETFIVDLLLLIPLNQTPHRIKISR